MIKLRTAKDSIKFFFSGKCYEHITFSSKNNLGVLVKENYNYLLIVALGIF